MALIGLNRDELDLSQLPKDSFYDPKKDDDLSGVQIRATITFRITNPDGTVVKEWTEPAHSLNYNFGLFIWALWSASQAEMNDTAGTSIYVQGASGGAWSVTAPSGNSSYGIVVGSGASAGSTPSPTAYKLVAQIPQGTSSGQIEYGVTSVGSPSQSGQTTSFTISRSFTNVSGSTINVTEIGIIVYVTGFAMTTVSTASAVSSDYVLIAYDIPSSAIAIQNGQTLTITYTFSVTT
jgi:hypothetical protein